LHKCLFEISDYCEFNWWNSCLSCWWWNYMLKLYIYVYFVFCSKLVKYDVLVDGLLMNSFLIDVVFVMRCCWWLEPWAIIIIELWWDFVWFLKVLQKRVKWWFVIEWCFDSCFIWIWVLFYVHKRINNLWGRILG